MMDKPHKGAVTPKKDDKDTLGLTVKKSEDFSEWYSQLVIKSELADYSPVSGCIIYRPLSYEIWERVQEIFNARIKATGHRNCYFPLFIPENLLLKEAKHVEGFSPEVAWVTHAGNTKLSERLAIRPTSETIMYDAYSQWVRSWRDLPLLLNQWNSVVRWEFKHAKPFLRGREFLWQEGHTAHATREEADREVILQLNEYIHLVQDYMAIAVIAGKKTESEKFAGADYTTAIEAFMPDGKALQMGTSHGLGQNFAKAFGIQFVDRDEERKYVWQTSWGLSTRTIGAMVMAHGDDKGLVIPPKIAPLQSVVIPIIFKDSKEKVIDASQDIVERLRKAGITSELDAREDCSAGFKFNHWELRGVPLRIEVGPKDLEKKQAVFVQRNNGKKHFIPLASLENDAKRLLDTIQKEMFDASRKHLMESIVLAKSKAEMKKSIEHRKLIKILFCLRAECEEDIKTSCDGATARCLPFDDQKDASGKCANCGHEAKAVAVFGKSY